MSRGVKKLFEGELLFSVADLWRSIVRHKGSISLGGFAFALFILGTMIIRGPAYTAQATFQEKAQSQSSGFGEKVLSMLASGSNEDAASEALMLSHVVVEDVVRTLGLHVNLGEEGASYSRLDCITTNVRLEKEVLRSMIAGKPGSSSSVLVADAPLAHTKPRAYRMKEASYSGAFCRNYKLQPLGAGKFELLDSAGQKTIWNFGQKVTLPDVSFVIEQIDASRSPKATISLVSLYDMTEGLRNAISIKRDKKNKRLLQISYSCGDPEQAARIVNQLMASFKSYLNDQHNKRVSEQLAYLTARQEQMTAQLGEKQDKHCEYLCSNIEGLGFCRYDRALKFFSGQQEKLHARRLQIELDQEILETNDGMRFQTFSSLGGEKAAQALFQERQELIQHRDLLELSLREHAGIKAKTSNKVIVDRIKELEEELSWIDQLRANVARPDQLARIFKGRKKALERLGLTVFIEQPNTPEWGSHLSAYLEMGARMRKMRSRLLEERLLSAQNGSLFFEGLDIKSAVATRTSYTELVNGDIATKKKFDYVLQQLDDPAIDIASLGMALDDEVSRIHIREAADITCKLHDTAHTSAKEEERYRSILALKRAFMKAHVKECARISGLQKRIWEDCLVKLDRSVVNLLNQKISVLAEQIEEMRVARKAKLRSEDLILQRELAVLSKRMQQLPRRGMEEMKLGLFIKMQQKMCEELTKMVEGRNLAQNLDRIESTVVDPAVVPVQPVPPQILISSALGLFLGSLCVAGLCFARDCRRGLWASESNLDLLGQRVLGKSDNHAEYTAQDLQTARSIAAFLREKGAKSVLGISLGRLLSLTAQLLASQGKRVLLIDGTWFVKQGHCEVSLAAYLEGAGPCPTATAMQAGYHLLDTGAFHPHAFELMNSAKFQEFMATLRGYDVVLLRLPLEPSSIEARGLVHLSDVTIVDASRSRINDLETYFNEKTAFVL